MMSYKRQGNKRIVYTFDDVSDVEDAVLSKNVTEDISYSHSGNVMGVATTRDESGALQYHVYQTNECGYIRWDRYCSSLKEAVQYAEEMHEGFISYSRALKASYEEFKSKEDVVVPRDSREVLNKSIARTTIEHRFILLVRDEREKVALEKILSSYNVCLKSALINEKIIMLAVENKGKLTSAISVLGDKRDGVVLLPTFDYISRKGTKLYRIKRALSGTNLKFDWTICKPLYHIGYESLVSPTLYADAINRRYDVHISIRESANKYRWNAQMLLGFLCHGIMWTSVQNEVKKCMVDSITSVSLNDGIVCASKEKEFSDTVAALVSALG